MIRIVRLQIFVLLFIIYLVFWDQPVISHKRSRWVLREREERERADRSGTHRTKPNQTLFDFAKFEGPSKHQTTTERERPRALFFFGFVG